MLDVPPDFEHGGRRPIWPVFEQETLAATLWRLPISDPDFRAFADLYDRGRTDNTGGGRNP